MTKKRTLPNEAISYLVGHSQCASPQKVVSVFAACQHGRCRSSSDLNDLDDDDDDDDTLHSSYCRGCSARESGRAPDQVRLHMMQSSPVV